MSPNNEKNYLTVALIDQKSYFAIFGQLWIVVYMGIIKILNFFKFYMLLIKNIEIIFILQKKVISKNCTGGQRFIKTPTMPNRVLIKFFLNALIDSALISVCVIMYINQYMSGQA